MVNSEAQILTAEDGIQDKLDQLEKSLFDSRCFQAFVILVFFTFCGMATWISFRYGLPFGSVG